MKRIIALFFMLMFCVSFYGCSSGSSSYRQAAPDFEYDNQEIDEEQDFEYDQIELPEYIEKNEDGVIPLEDLENADIDWLFHCRYGYKYEDDRFDEEDDCSVIVKFSQENPQKINQSDTLAVYEAINEVDFYKITNGPIYTMPWHFGRYNSYNDESEVSSSVCKFPPSRSEKAFDMEIEEINDTNYADFVNNNSITFSYYKNINLERWSHFIKILDLNKNQEIKLGGYVGTQWVEQTYSETIECYLMEYNPIEVSTSKTKNGYFTIDISSLDQGLYYIPHFHRIVEIV